MNHHCKDCKHHHDAGHPKNSIYAKKYNDWCCKFGSTAKKVIGHCKLHNGKDAEIIFNIPERYINE